MKDMVIIKREENNVTHGYDLKEIKKFVYDGTTMQIEVMFPQESIIFEGRQAEIVYNAINPKSIILPYLK